ncbi:aa3-type cytochrome c oxidase subunit IV [Hypericibacter sp.]
MAQDDQMLHDHQQAYKGFVKFSTIAAVLIAVALGLMGLTLL